MEASGDENLAFRDTGPSHRFNPPQSTYNFSRRGRPPTMDLSISASAEQEKGVPLATKKLDRRVSKRGLRGIFTRTKGQVEKNNVASPLWEGTIPTPATAQSWGSAPAPTVSDISSSTATPSTPATPAMTAIPTVQTKQSRLSLRSKSVKQNIPPNKPSFTPTKSLPRAPTRTSAAWDPPPLFQAWPQAIKHATLAASTLSADVIIRMNNHKRNDSQRDVAQTGEEGGAEQSAAAKKAEKAKNKHRRQISGSMSKADWTQKIFILVTSGYLLQYAGEGTHDRLPEKMMQLGKESVAFASDAIPGKHWVLQISQAMDADGAPASDPRSLLSRLAFRGSDYRRTATSLLLIMNSAEDMDSWLAIVRREIEALGGKEYVSETG